MRISVIGLGKLGAPLAAWLATQYVVIGVDSDPAVVEKINNGIPPVEEPGLKEMLLSVAGSTLSATTNVQRAVVETDVTFVVVPTPSEPALEGAFSLRYVHQAMMEIGAALRQKEDWHLVVVVSTINPGDMSRIEGVLEHQTGKFSGEQFGLCYNPEFVAIGNVLEGMQKPDLVLIGAGCERGGEQLREIYNKMAVGAPVMQMSWINAELTKLFLNVFVTMKISFANTVAALCEKYYGADCDVVTEALGKDSRIGPRSLRAGLGFGGPCLPRDNQALIRAAKNVGVDVSLSQASLLANSQVLQRVVQRIMGWIVPGKKPGFLGVAYKPGAGLLEESQAELLRRGLGQDIPFYDPCVAGSVPISAIMRECDLVVIGLPLDEFRILPEPSSDRQIMPVIIDPWRVVNAEDAMAKGYTYIPMGKAGF